MPTVRVYHGTAWFMLVVLLVLCAVNPLLIGGFPYRRSIVRSFGVWLMVFALLVEHWCLIKGFRIVGAVCGISICSQWILYTEKRSFDVIFHVCPNELLNKQWICKWVDKPLVASGLPVARNCWSGVLVVQCAAIPSTLDSPQKRSAWCFLPCLPERYVYQTVKLPVSWNPMTRMQCHCCVSFINPLFRMVEHQDYYVTVILKV